MTKIFTLITAAAIFTSLAFTKAEGSKWFTKTGKVTFFSSTPVEDIKAVNNQMILAFDDATGQISTRVTIKSFLFKKKLMQEHFNENYMESDKFPYATYKGFIKNMKNIDLTKDSIYKVTTSGNLTIHGVTKKVTTTGTITSKSGKATIDASFDVLLKDYNIEKPSVVALKIADKINVNLYSVCSKKK